MRGKTRKVTGASFVILDGALKTADCNVQANVVEDGVAIRLRPEALTELAECLCQGRDFIRQSPSMTFRLEWNRTMDDKAEPFSPIDHKSLMGCWQYGVDQSRLLTSINVIPGIAEWALRLSAVYNLDEARPVAPMESKMFSISEQIAAQVAVSISPFVRSLIRRNMNIAIRVQLTAETAEYQTGQWTEMTEEHSLWMSTLDEMLVPSLYNFCSYVNGFHVELHLAIVSTRPLPI